MPQRLAADAFSPRSSKFCNGPTSHPPGGDTRRMNLETLRRLDDDAEAAIRRISIVKLTATILIVYAVTLAAMLLLRLLTG